MHGDTAAHSELPLVLAAQRREPAAMQMLVARDTRWVRAVIAGLLSDAQAVDDAVQDVWVRAWQQVSQLRDPQRWRAWLYRLARNVAADAGRRISRERRISQPLEALGPTAAAAPRAEHVAERMEEHRRVLAAVQGLPALYREPLVLRYLEGWSYRQIGETLDVPTDTVETRLVRARRLLREALT